MPLGVSDLLVQTLSAETSLSPCGKREDILLMTREPLRKCIINYTINLSPTLQWKWSQVDLNASIIKHLCPWDKGGGS